MWLAIARSHGDASVAACAPVHGRIPIRCHDGTHVSGASRWSFTDELLAARGRELAIRVGRELALDTIHALRAVIDYSQTRQSLVVLHF
jgi:hypothetical protein